MTNDEAKFRLQAYRSNGADGADPAMLEALEHAQRDEALRAWLAREQAFDAVVAAKLREVSPPAGLRESILAGTQMTRRSGALTRRRFPAWLAQAAAVALLVAVATIAVRLFEAKAPATVDDLVHLAVDDLKPVHLTVTHADELGEVGAWFERPDRRLRDELPFTPAQLKASGCRVVKIGEREIFEICFRRGEWFHVYFTPRAGMRGLDEAGELIMREQRGLTIASWADSKFIYVLAGVASPEVVRSLL